MKAELDFKTEEITLDALLDKINEQRKFNSELQSELRTIRSRENRLHKTSEAIKSENRRLHEDLAALEQKIRELDIQLTLPESERTHTINRNLDTLPKKSAFHTFNWGYVIAPLVVISAIVCLKWFWSGNTTPTASSAAISNSLVAPVSAQVPITTATPVAAAATTTAQPTVTSQAAPVVPVLEEGYLIVNNPLIADDPVRIRDGFGSRAREVAFVDPGTKFKIREQSPNKMKRAILIEGKTLTVEDYFYKISDKEQWIFGFFTNRRTYNLGQ